MPLQAAPDLAARHIETLSGLADLGLQFSRILCHQAEQPGANHHALALAFTDIAQGVRRAILLSCSLEHLVQAAAQPKPPARARTERRNPLSGAPGPERGDRLDRPDTFDALDTLPGLSDDVPVDAQLDAMVATLEHDIVAAAASVLDIPAPLRPPASSQPNRHARRALARRNARC